MSTYPEHEKLAKVSAESQVIGEFLEWLDGGQVLCVAQWLKTTDSGRPRIQPLLVPYEKSAERLLAVYFGIDLKMVEIEKRAMIEELRRGNAREEVQNRCAAALQERRAEEWTAPCGILQRIEPFGKGLVRTVTFGVARRLDAVLLVIQPDNLSLRAEGPLAHACPASFRSAEDFIAWAADPWRART